MMMMMMMMMMKSLNVLIAHGRFFESTFEIYNYLNKPSYQVMNSALKILSLNCNYIRFYLPFMVGKR